MEAWHIWIILGILFLIMEVFTISFFFASLTAGAFLSAIGAALGASPTLQILILSIGTLLVFVGIRPFLKLFHKKEAGQIKTGVDALIGRPAVVIEKIDKQSNSGRVKIGGEEWRAASMDNSPIEAGSSVIILKIQGVTAFVERTSQEQRNPG